MQSLLLLTVAVITPAIASGETLKGAVTLEATIEALEADLSHRARHSKER